MKKLSLYDEAHIIVAAIRLFEYKNSASPEIFDITELTGMNKDKVSFLTNRLIDEKIIDGVKGAFGKTNFLINDYTLIETLPREVKESKMEDEIKKFKEKSKNAFENKAKAFAEEKKKKEKQLFDDLTKKFKEEMNKKKEDTQSQQEE